VLVDFNHPYAGKTILAKLKVVDVIKDEKEKAKKLVERRIPDAEVVFEDSTMIVKVPQKYMLSDNIQLVKAMIVSDVFKFIPSIKTIRFVEEVQRPEEKPVEESEGSAEQQES
jgi:peptidylprolyl isomerase